MNAGSAPTGVQLRTGFGEPIVRSPPSILNDQRHRRRHGEDRSIDCLLATETNSYQGKSYPVSHPTDYTMPADPGHKFSDVLMQLAGEKRVPGRRTLPRDR
jgi:hypothetical protein